MEPPEIINCRDLVLGRWKPAWAEEAAKAGFIEVERVESEPTAPGHSGLDVVWERRG